MTKLLDEAIAKARELPEAEQDIAAEALMAAIHRGAPTYRLTPDQVDEVKRIQAKIEDSTATFATDEEMAALWKKCGL